jgi:type I restriction enzyme S subunit
MTNKINKQTQWYGDLPERWKIILVKRLFFIGRGRVISQQELDENGRYPVFSSQTKNNGCLGYINSYDYDIEQITWTTDGANAGTVFYRNGKHNCTNVCGTLQPNENNKHNMRCLYYCLLNAVPHYKRKDTNGFKIMNNEMGVIEFPLPSLPEQTQIVRFLDWKVSRINKLINAKRRQIELLKEQKQGIINEKLRMENGKLRDGWVVRRLKTMVNDTNIKASPIGKFYVGMENVVSWTATYLETGLSAEGDCKQFNKGDVLFGKLRPYLAKVYLPDKEGVCSGEFLVLRDFNGYLPYLKYLLLTQDFIALVNASTYGAKMPRANWDFIGNCVLPFPKIHEQKSIVSYLDERCADIDKLISKLQEEITLFTEYRTRLISDVVTGKMDVREVDVPEYENDATAATVETQCIASLQCNAPLQCIASLQCNAPLQCIASLQCNAPMHCAFTMQCVSTKHCVSTN